MLITGLCECGSGLLLSFRKKSLAKVGIPSYQFLLDMSEKLPRNGSVGLATRQLRRPECGGFAGNLLGENGADKIFPLRGRHEQKAAVIRERQEAQRFQLGGPLGFRPALHGQN